MMLTRNDQSLIGRWWWTVDRLMLGLILMLLMTGVWLALTASPAVAVRSEVDSLYFFRKQLLFLVPALVGLITVSLFSPRWVRRMAVIGLPVALLLVLATIVFGDPVKGATRWIRLAGFSLQPSEFLKPFFIVTTAWILSAAFGEEKLPVKRVALGLYLLVVLLLVLQPDFGQTLLVTAVWTAQMIMAGLPAAGIALVGLVGLAGLIVAYFTVPYFAGRIDRFINPASGDTYQVDLARQAFENGGLVGRGPGEGTVKLALPDAHSDYVFAVVGEEFGAVAGVMLILIFAAIVLRGLVQLSREDDPFKLLAGVGLVMQFGLQAIINIGVNTDLLPSKGMTLPFISYGGSSMLALAMSMGMVLALTRRDRVHRGLGEGLIWGGRT